MGKKASHKGKGQLLKYKSLGRFYTNKKRKLERHVKEHPEDHTALKSLKESSKHHWVRKKPDNRIWRSAATKDYAHTLRLLGYTAEQIRYECFVKPKEILMGKSNKDKNKVAEEASA